MPKKHNPAARPSRLMTLTDAAEFLAVSVDTVRRRVADGSIPGYRVGRAIRVSADDVWAYVTPIPAVQRTF